MCKMHKIAGNGRPLSINLPLQLPVRLNIEQINISLYLPNKKNTIGKVGAAGAARVSGPDGQL